MHSHDLTGVITESGTATETNRKKSGRMAKVRKQTKTANPRRNRPTANPRKKIPGERATKTPKKPREIIQKSQTSLPGTAETDIRKGIQNRKTNRKILRLKKRPVTGNRQRNPMKTAKKNSRRRIITITGKNTTENPGRTAPRRQIIMIKRSPNRT